MRKNSPQFGGNTVKKPWMTRDAKHFIAIVGVIVGSFLLIASIGVFAYVHTAVAESRPMDTSVSGQVQNPVANTDEPEEKGGFIANLLQPPEKTNFLIVGLDEGESLTDAIMVGCFDRDTQQITLISVPRDTYTKLSQEDIDALNAVGRYPPSHGVMKINAIHAYAGKAYGMEYLKKYLEGMLDIEIDYYASVDLRAFRNIVNAIGGVWMDIPQGGMYYNDPDQNLTISVPGGHQLLDGEKAEGVVRFRAEYREGDMKRIEVQHEFMKQFFAQVLTKDAIMKNLGSFLTTVISYVRTDFGIQDIPMYLRYATSLKGENITFLTLPGEAEYRGEASYFFPDEERVAEMVQEVFSQGTEESAEPVAADSHIAGLRVQLLNGTGVPGQAAGFEEILSAAGVQVVQTGDYAGSKKTYTRVLAREAGIAEGFQPYFANVNEELDAVGISDRFDAVIIIGTGEATVESPAEN